MKRLVFSLFLMVAATGTTQAEGQYVSVKYMMINAEFELSGSLPADFEILNGLSADVDPISLALVFGNELSPNFAIEGTFLLRSWDKKFNGILAADWLQIEMSSLLDISAVGKKKLSPSIEIFGKAGLAYIEFKDSWVHETASGTGLSYGFGANFIVSQNASIFVEYLSLPDADYEDDTPLTVSSSSINIGATFKFD